MTEEPQQPDSDEPEAEAAGARAGERLREARREQQISVLEVAKELHLDEAKVRALERNEFDKLGAPVFAKGHLRKYSELVGVDPDDVFADYYQMTRSEAPPPVVVAARSKPRQELSPGPWVAALIVIVIAAATYWWFVVRPQSIALPTATAPETVVPEQRDAPAPSPAPVQPEPDNAAAAQQQPAQAVTEPEAEPETETVAEGEIRVSLQFSGDCWTEISDARGRRLFFDMGRAGREVELSGTAPLAVLFGNAENVAVEVNGEAYPVSPSNPGSRTARLSIVSP